MNMNGLVLWQGRSLLDNEPIVAIATGFREPSSNVKTGPMVQIWIMHATLNPQLAATQSGQDRAVCGDCRFRMNPLTGERECYVALWQAPRSVFDCFSRGEYAELDWSDPDQAMRDLIQWFAGQITRLGAYGDPSMVPAWLWHAVAKASAGWTGYTHQWAHRHARIRDNAEELRSLLMASVDTIDEQGRAVAAGWRTFRVRRDGERGQTLAGESTCPASKEAGHRVSCFDCRYCSGTNGRGSHSVAIDNH